MAGGEERGKERPWPTAKELAEDLRINGPLAIGCSRELPGGYRLVSGVNRTIKPPTVWSSGASAQFLRIAAIGQRHHHREEDSRLVELKLHSFRRIQANRPPDDPWTTPWVVATPTPIPPFFKGSLREPASLWG